MSKIEINTFNYIHLASFGKFKLVREIYTDTHDTDMVKKAIETKKIIESSRKTLYELFDDTTRKQLIELDKEVSKAYAEFCKKTPPMSLDDNKTLTCAIDREGQIEIPVSDKSYRIYTFFRDKDVFIKDNERAFRIDGDPRDEPRIRQYSSIINNLAKKLYIHTEFIKYAIETCLKDEETYDLAIELAKYIGYINNGQKEEIKKLHK